MTPQTLHEVSLHHEPRCDPELCSECVLEHILTEPLHDLPLAGFLMVSRQGAKTALEPLPFFCSDAGLYEEVDDSCPHSAKKLESNTKCKRRPRGVPKSCQRLPCPGARVSSCLCLNLQTPHNRWQRWLAESPSDVLLQCDVKFPSCLRRCEEMFLQQRFPVLFGNLQLLLRCNFQKGEGLRRNPLPCKSCGDQVRPPDGFPCQRNVRPQMRRHQAKKQTRTSIRNESDLCRVCLVFRVPVCAADVSECTQSPRILCRSVHQSQKRFLVSRNQPARLVPIFKK
mmetsp:Transcript_28331/g.55471  ORF Transcript_28331/g.55471 Transcript_28331/m.55471 type:complete len:283 (+) Transcript_28331:563-1411(+)